MAIDPTAMNALLDKLEAARAAFTKPASVAAGQAGVPKSIDFAKVLQDSIARVNDGQKEAMTLAERFQLGDSKVTIEETMVALSKANISFQQMVQVRNRVIAAYHDIMNMQI